VVTDTRTGAPAGNDPLAVVRAAVAAATSLGVAPELAVQVRVEDDVTDRQAYELTRSVLGVCRTGGVLCLVNDRLHIALAAAADGAHVGADDLPVAAARRVLGLGAADDAVPPVLGVTCRNPDAARRAAADGASYLGVGPAFVTGTKSALPDPIGPAGVASVAGAVPDTPVIAIGGVTVASVAVLRAAGAHGVAVVGALSSAADPYRVTAELLAAVTA
jgi:thiamine-phosphate pyrophosphorylase